MNQLKLSQKVRQHYKLLRTLIKVAVIRKCLVQIVIMLGQDLEIKPFT